MESDKKKYTADDWLDDLLPDEPLALYQKGGMSLATLEKINEFKVQAFNISVDLKVQMIYENFVHTLKAKRDSQAYLKAKISRLEKMEEDPELMELIHGVSIALEKTTGGMYQYLLQCEQDKTYNGGYRFENKEIYKAHKVHVNYRFLQKLKSLQNDENQSSDLWEKLTPRVQRKIDAIAKNIDADGRSNYKYEEIRNYLGIYKARPELRTCRARKDVALGTVSDESADRLRKAESNTLGQSWEHKLDQALE